MVWKSPIRVKLLVGLTLLVSVVAILSSSGLIATYAYRDLVKSLRHRVVELPLAVELSRNVSDLRITLSELRGLSASSFPATERVQVPRRARGVRDDFQYRLAEVEQTLRQYKVQLEYKLRSRTGIGDNQEERVTVDQIAQALRRVHQANSDRDWILNEVVVDGLDEELAELQTLAERLPSHLHEKLRGFADEVKGPYRVLIVGTWIACGSAALIFALFMQLCYRWILQPLRTLIHGSRRVAAGQFGYRIHLDTEDEMSELAEAMNDMTARFKDIRDDLDQQVRQRTKQVVRSEQLASVGFLAAGVAHEINNPLASIAMCAESLQGRIGEVLDLRATNRESDAVGDSSADNGHAVIGNYLQMIQDEAFRCKEITEKLLDFSRVGHADRQDAELGELVQGVIEMVGHLGKYQQKQIDFAPGQPVVAAINVQQLKQVVLNLLANALDSTAKDGLVQITLQKRGRLAELTFTDNGCGMEPDVLEHVFEPFFTRRRVGQGTGLGLSITYRIVADHGGEITASSPGAGLGATFRVRLPMVQIGGKGEGSRHAA